MNTPSFQRAAVAVAIVAALAAAAGAGYWFARARTPASAHGDAAATGPDGRRILYWYDPMVPAQRFDQPGRSPFMDMDLIPKYADDSGGAGVKIDPRLAQSLGLRLATVTRERLAPRVDAVASVMLNDRDVAIVQARSAGFVERVHARAAGDVIAAGAPLAEVLVPEWAGAQQEYLAVRAAGDASLTASARQRLVLLGMPADLIERVERERAVIAVTTLTAPAGGVIQELMIRNGMAIVAGMTLARINGLASVWLEAAVPEAQAGPLAPGRAVEARLATYPGEVFKGKVDAILPEANRETRTLRVRMVFANPGLRLRPGMYAQVALQGAAEDVLVVPSEAVIRTGQRTLVFVAEGEGRYRPVAIETGREIDGKLVVRSGLDEGLQVVASGQFLIDSEASMSGIVAAAPGQAAGKAAGKMQVHEASGVVVGVGADEVMVEHGPVPTLKWGAMTMGFKPGAARAQLSALKAGDRVQFRFHQDDDGFTLDSIARAADESHAGAAHGGAPTGGKP